jgi:hypothetical protein
MSLTVKQAEAKFDKAIRVPGRVLIVDGMVTWGSGFPANRQALYEATVVLAVAAWQSFTEDIARAVLRATVKSAGSQGSKLEALTTTSLEASIRRFNTPNMENTRDLFRSVGFDLGDSWNLTLQGAPLMSHEAGTLVNAWLQVRHSVAHGVPFHKNDKLMKLRALGSYVNSRVLTIKKPPGGSIGFGASDAAGCRDLFIEMKNVIGVSAAAHCKAL